MAHPSSRDNRRSKRLVEKPEEEIDWIDQEKGYKTCSFTSFYGGIKQRWLLVFSEPSLSEREIKSLEKN